MNLTLIEQDLKSDEGFRAKPYYDTVGKLSIGFGRNLDDRGITTDEADYLLRNDVQNAVNDLFTNILWFETLSDNRQRALVEMVFQLGITKLLGFGEMLRYMQNGDYKLAAREALSSKWALQVPKRAARIAALIQNG